MNKSKYKHLDDQIIILYKGGKSTFAIARELGLYSSAIGYRVKMLGISRSISESLVGQVKSEAHKKALSLSRKISGVAKGSKNPNWQGGVTPEHEKIRHNTEQMLWKKAVKKRDGRCMSCGSVKRLHAHHILPFATFPHLRTSISNGVTLCYDCHTTLHKGVKSTCRELLETLTVNDEGNQQPSLSRNALEGSETMYCTRKR